MVLENLKVFKSFYKSIHTLTNAKINEQFLLLIEKSNLKIALFY
jgi:hypothetical protein